MSLADHGIGYDSELRFSEMAGESRALVGVLGGYGDQGCVTFEGTVIVGRAQTLEVDL